MFLFWGVCTPRCGEGLAEASLSLTDGSNNAWFTELLLLLELYTDTEYNTWMFQCGMHRAADRWKLQYVAVSDVLHCWWGAVKSSLHRLPVNSTGSSARFLSECQSEKVKPSTSHSAAERPVPCTYQWDIADEGFRHSQVLQPTWVRSRDVFKCETDVSSSNQVDFFQSWISSIGVILKTWHYQLLYLFLGLQATFCCIQQNQRHWETALKYSLIILGQIQQETAHITIQRTRLRLLFGVQRNSVMSSPLAVAVVYLV